MRHPKPNPSPHPNFNPNVDPGISKAVVDEARRGGFIVAAHAHGRPGILAAINAGVHTIEHGSMLDDETAGMMAAAGMILVPTRFAIERLLLTLL